MNAAGGINKKSMKEISIVFPHQLFEESPLLDVDTPVVLVEESLFFTQVKFHKQKLVLHRASMQFYKHFLENMNRDVSYIDAGRDTSDIRMLVADLAGKGIDHLHFIDPVDDWLKKRILNTCANQGIEWTEYESPMFINKSTDLEKFFRKNKKKYFQTSFYKDERKRLNILMEGDGEPTGGRWTYDDQNRLKYPKDKSPPKIVLPSVCSWYNEALAYVDGHFGKNYGRVDKQPLYPVNYDQAKNWFGQFLEERFSEFGPYEDAIVKGEVILNHSVLTPALNIGLITPQYVLERLIEYGSEHKIPINSIEGFVRQVMGWREFIRGVYLAAGSRERTTNFWGFQRKMPNSFYTAETGIDPVDDAIEKVLRTGYCHHIERLMVLGNFMLLCEIHPDEVYRWFMELFVDAYDWVMLPNVMGMSQYADGGILATKPYISGGNYLHKMGNWFDSKDQAKQSEFTDLYWKFLQDNYDKLKDNHRMQLVLSQTKKKMDD